MERSGDKRAVSSTNSSSFTRFPLPANGEASPAVQATPVRVQVSKLGRPSVPPLNTPSTAVFTASNVRRHINEGQGPDNSHQLLVPSRPEGGNNISKQDLEVWQGTQKRVLRKLRFMYSCQVNDFVVVWITNKPGIDIWWVARVLETDGVIAFIEYEGRPGDRDHVSLQSRRLFTGDLTDSHIWRAEGHDLALTPQAIVAQMYGDHAQVLLETHSRERIGALNPTGGGIPGWQRLPTTSTNGATPTAQLKGTAAPPSKLAGALTGAARTHSRALHPNPAASSPPDGGSEYHVQPAAAPSITPPVNISSPLPPGARPLAPAHPASLPPTRRGTSMFNLPTFSSLRAPVAFSMWPQGKEQIEPVHTTAAAGNNGGGQAYEAPEVEDQTTTLASTVADTGPSSLAGNDQASGGASGHPRVHPRPQGPSSQLDPQEVRALKRQKKTQEEDVLIASVPFLAAALRTPGRRRPHIYRGIKRPELVAAAKLYKWCHEEVPQEDAAPQAGESSSGDEEDSLSEAESSEGYESATGSDSD